MSLAAVEGSVVPVVSVTRSKLDGPPLLVDAAAGGSSLPKSAVGPRVAMVMRDSGVAVTSGSKLTSVPEDDWTPRCRSILAQSSMLPSHRPEVLGSLFI